MYFPSCFKLYYINSHNINPVVILIDDSPSEVCLHSNALIGDEVFVWGGDKPDLPEVHDSLEKRQFTSSVNVYNVLDGSYVKRPTTGTPHTGTMGCSCCSVGSDIYYFGGYCIHPVDCYHNNLSALNTISDKWREIVCDDGPMKKFAFGMTPLSIDGQDFLLIIGGIGPLPAIILQHTVSTHLTLVYHHSITLMRYTSCVYRLHQVRQCTSYEIT